MPIYQKTPQSEVNNYLLEQIEKRENSIVRTLQYIGTECVNEAKTNSGYIDQTGNLRSSIGYVVLKNGVAQNNYQSTFDVVKQGESGKHTGTEFLNSLISQNSKGIVLIVVAGMNYAAHVEATGRNVVTSAELLAEKLVPQILKEIGFKVK